MGDSNIQNEQALLANTTVFVIDDDKQTAEMLRRELTQVGANVVVADSAEAALALYRLTPPDVIISEMHLGSSDGYAFIRAIREYNKEYRGFTPAIALTEIAHEHPRDEERAMAAGFDAYIHRPFNPAEVVDTITRLLRKPRDHGGFRIRQ